MAKFNFSPAGKFSGNPDKARHDAEIGLYKRDRYAWSIEQAKALRERRFASLDTESLAEEIAEVGRGQSFKLEGALISLLMLLLKWDHQPADRSLGCQTAIGEQRDLVADTLQENPSLKAHVDQLVREAYVIARDRASREAGFPLERFPAINPYDWQLITEREIAFDEGRRPDQERQR